MHYIAVPSRKTVIQKSPGIDPEHVGSPIWQLSLCLLLSWLVVVLCLIKGVKSSGKVRNCQIYYHFDVISDVIVLWFFYHISTENSAKIPCCSVMSHEWGEIPRQDTQLRSNNTFTSSLTSFLLHYISAERSMRNSKKLRCIVLKIIISDPDVIVISPVNKKKRSVDIFK